VRVAEQEKERGQKEKETAAEGKKIEKKAQEEAAERARAADEANKAAVSDPIKARDWDPKPPTLTLTSTLNP